MEITFFDDVVDVVLVTVLDTGQEAMPDKDEADAVFITFDPAVTADVFL
jgi:hypothetical protein